MRRDTTFGNSPAVVLRTQADAVVMNGAQEEENAAELKIPESTHVACRCLPW